MHTKQLQTKQSISSLLTRYIQHIIQKIYNVCIIQTTINVRVSPTGDDRMSGKGNAATLPGIKAKHTMHNIIHDVFNV